MGATLPAGSVRNPKYVVDPQGATFNAQTLLEKYFTTLNGTGQVLSLLDGTYQFASVLPDINGFYVEMSPGAILQATVKNGLRLRLAGNDPCGVIGGEVQNLACKRFNLSAVTQAGGIGTAITFTTTEEHSFQVGDSVRLQNIVMTASTLNNLDWTVATVPTPITFTVSAGLAGVDINDSIVYPYLPMDGAGRTIYPTASLARSASSANPLMTVVSATDFLLRGTKYRWTSGAGIYVANSSGGVIEYNEIIETSADGLTLVALSNEIDLNFNKVRGAGDDGISVVSYKVNGGRCYAIRGVGNEVRQGYFGGGGIAIWGGENIRLYNSTVEDVYIYGLNIGSSVGYNTYGVDDVVVEGISIKTAGRSTATTPTGWLTSNISAILLNANTTLYSEIVSNVHVLDWSVLNSRYKAVSGNTAPIIGLELGPGVIEESQGAGIDTLPLIGGKIHDVNISFTSNASINMGDTNSEGLNFYDDIEFSNMNVGTRCYIKTVSVALPSLTIRTYPEYTGTIAGTNTIVAHGIGSSYTSVSNTDAEVARDFQINNRVGGVQTWTVASVATDAVNGDVLTITVPTVSISGITRSGSTATATVTSTAVLKTGMFVWVAGADQTEYNGWKQITVASATTFTYAVTGTPTTPATGTLTYAILADTSHANPTVPENASPMSWVALSTGAAASTDGITVPSTIVDKKEINRPRFVGQLFTFERPIDVTASVVGQVLINRQWDYTNKNAADGTPTYYNPQWAPVAVTSTGNGTITATAVSRFGATLRSAQTAARTDTLPTAATIVAAVTDTYVFRRFKYEYYNTGDFPITLGTATGLTLSGSMVISPRTMAAFDISITNNVTGSEAVTVTRWFGGVPTNPSGTWTPTVTAVTNVSAVGTQEACNYSISGGVCTCSGKLVGIDPTGAGAASVRISLPIVSAITNAREVGGVGSSAGIAGQSGQIIGDAANDAALLNWIAVDITAQDWGFVFQFQIL